MIRVAEGNGGAWESEFSTAEGRRIRDAVRDLVPLIRKNAPASEKAGAVVEETLSALQKTGLFTCSLPAEYGGFALGARDMAEILTEVSRGDGSVGWITMTATAHSRIVLSLPQEAIDEVYAEADSWNGPIFAAGSLFSERIQKAEKVDGGYIIKAGGIWPFASGCAHATFSAVGIDYEDDAGQKHRGMVLLDRNQYEILDDWDVMGMRASSSNSLTVTKDVFAPDYRYLDLTDFPKRLETLHERYEGLNYAHSPLGLALFIGLEMMCTVLGMAKGGLELMIEQAQKRKPYNLPYEKVSHSAASQVSAAKAAAMVASAESLLMAQADRIDQKGRSGQAFTPAEEAEVVMFMVYAGNICGQALELMLYTIGSSAIASSNPIQRYMRDAMVALSHGALRLDPVAEIHGRQMLGLPPFADFSPQTPGVSNATKEQKAQPAVADSAAA